MPTQYTTASPLASWEVITTDGATYYVVARSRRAAEIMARDLYGSWLIVRHNGLV